MKGICALEVEQDKIKALLASSGNNYFKPLAEIGVRISSDHFFHALSEGIGSLEEEIRNREKKHSLDIEKTYCRLPLDLAKVKIVEDTIPFSPRKKKLITSKVIAGAKKYIEDVALEWNEICVHDIILEYQVDGSKYLNLPSNLEGSKLKLKVFLVYKIYLLV